MAGRKGKIMANVRIQKVLSENGILSRRKAEEYVAAGRITINGRKAQIGAAIDPRRDIVAVDGIRVDLSPKVQKVYILLNKPRGYVTTLSDELGRRCVAELVEDAPERVYPVGRLDKDSEGALLLTNDGEFANLIMHPSHHINKTYRVTVRPGVSEDQVVQLSTGVMIDDRMTAPAQVNVLERTPERAVLQIVIHEGRNRQIRKMCEAVGLEVARLRRSSIGPIRLGMLQPGKWRELTPQEVGAIRSAVKERKLDTRRPPKAPVEVKASHTMDKNFGRPVSRKPAPKRDGRDPDIFAFKNGRPIREDWEERAPGKQGGARRPASRRGKPGPRG